MNILVHRWLHAAVNGLGALALAVMPSLQQYAAAHPSSLLGIVLGLNAALHFIPDSVSAPNA